MFRRIKEPVKRFSGSRDFARRLRVFFGRHRRLTFIVDLVFVLPWPALWIALVFKTWGALTPFTWAQAGTDVRYALALFMLGVAALVIGILGTAPCAELVVEPKEEIDLGWFVFILGFVFGVPFSLALLLYGVV